MNLAEFLTALEQTPRDWQLIDGAVIRRFDPEAGEMCPISSLKNCPRARWGEISEEVGLNAYLTVAIVKASDIALFNSTLRQDLLRACGLVEK